MPHVLIGTTRPRHWPAVLALLPCLASAACSHSGSAPTLALATPPAAQPILVAQLDAPATIVTAYAPASAGAALGLEDAVRRAVGWHPSIDEAMARLMQQAEAINIARSGAFPSVSGGLSLGTDDAIGGSSLEPQLNLSATQTLFDFGKLSSSVAAATAGTNVSRAQVLLAADKVILDTAYAVIEVQRFEALRETALAHLSGVQDIATLVRQRTDTGASARSDTVEADLRIQAAEATVLQVEADLARWKSRLAYLTGADGPVGAQPGVPQWLAGTCTAEPVWANIPALMQAEAQGAQAKAQLDFARAEALPTLSLDVGTGLDLSHIDDSPEVRIGLDLSGKLFDGGAGGARSNAADYAMRAANSAAEAARTEVALALADARNRTAGLQRLIGSMRERDALLIETRDLYRRQYFDLGTRTLLDVLNAERDLHQGRLEMINAEHDIRKLRLDCMYNSGTARQAFGLSGQTIRGVPL